MKFTEQSIALTKEYIGKRKNITFTITHVKDYGFDVCCETKDKNKLYLTSWDDLYFECLEDAKNWCEKGFKKKLLQDNI